MNNNKTFHVKRRGLDRSLEFDYSGEGDYLGWKKSVSVSTCPVKVMQGLGIGKLIFID